MKAQHSAFAITLSAFLMIAATSVKAAESPLSLVMTASPNPVRPGETINYVMTVVNQSTNDLNGVKLHHVMPAYMVRQDQNFATVPWESWTGRDSYIDAGEIITWNLATLPAGQSHSVVFAAQVAFDQFAPPNNTPISSSADVIEGGGSGASVSAIVTATANPLLRLSMVADHNPAKAGDKLTYVLTYGHSGSVSVPDVKLRAQIPAGTTFSSASAGVIVSGNEVTWNLETMLPGSSGQRVLVVEVSSPIVPAAIITNHAVIGEDLARADTATVVQSSPTLALTMTASPDPVRPGEQINYVITAINRGSGALTGVKLHHVMPAWMVTQDQNFATVPWESWTGRDSYIHAGEMIEWNLGTLPAGQSRSVVFAAQMSYGQYAPPDNAIFPSCAEVSASNGVGAAASASVIADASPALRLSMTGDRNPATPGETLTYTLSYGNSASDFSNGVLRAQVPAGTTFVSAGAGGVLNGSEVSWDLGTVKAGAAGQRMLRVMVNSGLSEGTILASHAQVGGGEGRADTVTVVQSSPTLSLTMTASPDPVRPGEQINYVITAINRGTGALTGVKLHHVMPAWMVTQDQNFATVPWESWTGRDSYIHAGEMIEWNLGTLPAGQSRSVVFAAQMAYGQFAPPDNAIFPSCAEVSASTGGGAAASASVIADASPALRLSMTGDRNPVAPGETLTFTLSYGNPAADYSAAVLRAQVPAGTTFVSAGAGGVLNGSEVFWELGTVKAGAAGQRVLRVTANSGLSEGTILAGHGQVGAGEGRADTATVVQSSPTLALTMTASPDPVRPGEQINYVITAINRGSGALTGVKLHHVMPAWMVTQDQNFATVPWESWTGRDSYIHAGEMIEWNLGTLPAGQSRSVVFAAQMSYGQYAPPDNAIFPSCAEVSASNGVGAAASASVIADASPALVLAMVGNRDPVVAGDTLTYSLKYGNPSASSFSEAVLRAEIPAGTTFVPASASGSGVLNGNEVEWDIGTIGGGAVGQQTFSVTVNSTLSDGTIIAGHAQVGDGEGRADTAAVLQNSPTLALTMTSTPDPGRPGKQINYVITAINRGATALSGVKLRHVMPAWMVTQDQNFATVPWESWTGRDSYIHAGEIITWNLGTLPAGQSRPISFGAQLISSADGLTQGTLIFSAAEVSSTNGVGSKSSGVVRIGNTPPNLPAILDQSVAEGTLLTFPIVGHDGDVPPDALTYSLVGPPIGAGIDPITGVFSWIPTEAQGPGTHSITVRVTDNGTPNLTDEKTFIVAVNEVNAPPTFTKGQNQTANEEAGVQTVNNWATGITVGPSGDAGTTVTFSVNSDNTTLFSVPPAISSTGTLTYTAAPNANGVAHVTVAAKDDGGTANGGVDTSTPQTFMITVNSVNDAPSFTKGSDQTVNEDAGPQTVTGWGTAISRGPADEAGQKLTFVLSGSNSGLFSAPLTIDETGTLTYTPATNANGSATVTVVVKDDGGTANGGVDTSGPQTLTITISPVNDPPTLDTIGNMTLSENAGPQIVNLSGISAGPNDEVGQTLTVTATSDNPGLVPNPTVIYVSPNAAGSLSFQPVAKTSGVATIKVIVSDNGGTADGGADVITKTFNVAVNTVNHAPSFIKGSDISINEDAGPQSVPGWATAISAGVPNEASQKLTFLLSTDNDALFSAAPTIDADGTLSFTPAANANGIANVTVTLRDDGGTANGGTDTSGPQSFKIDVKPVNDPPSFSKGADQIVNQGSGPQTIANWATAISAGPPNEADQALFFRVGVNNPALFSVAPVISATGTLTYSPAANVSGTAAITVSLQDEGGTANRGVDTSSPENLVISVKTQPVSQSLAAYYPFDGDARDSSGNGLDGTVKNGSFVSGKIREGLDFSAGNSFVEVPNAPLLNPDTAVSFSLWVRPRSFPNAYSCLVYKASSEPTNIGFVDRSYSLWLRDDGGVHLTSVAGNSFEQTVCDSSAGGVRLSSFAHIVGIVDTSSHTMKIYLNGRQVSSCPFVGTKIQSGNYPLRIGGPYNTLSDQSGLDGVLDEVRIFNKALSDDEIAELYRTTGPSYSIGTSSSPPSFGTTGGGGNYTSGQFVTVAATANPGYTFVNWTENGNQVSTSADYLFTANANRDLVANFTKIAATFAWPVDFPQVTNPYYVTNSTTGKRHTGLDVVSSTGGLIVRAAADGIVKIFPRAAFDPNNTRLGNTIVIDHYNDKGPFTLYGHLASFSVSDGQAVTRGQQIGIMGDSGKADGIHLHFEVKFWGVVGNLDDNLGPEWGYSPGHPNLYGYINPRPYLDYNLNLIQPVAVKSSANQILRSGPDSSVFTTTVTTINADQRFVAFAEYNGWYQIYLPSSSGPASGWIQATPDATADLLQVKDSARGKIGVSVRDAASSNASLLSYVWDKQWLVKLDETGSGNGCGAFWYQVPIAPSGGTSFGWVCGSYLLSNQSGPVLSIIPGDQLVLSAAGNTAFNIANTGGGVMSYSATVTSGDSWLQITSGGSGGNSGTISASYSANAGAQRSGTIVVTAITDTGARIGPVTLTINQAASGNSGGTFYLSFPLAGQGPYTTEITTVFDHATSGRYHPGGGVIAYTDERGTEKDSREQPLDFGPGLLYSFKKADDSPFRINGHYVGTQGPTGTGPTTLNYDGHPGYDYPVPIGTDIYAAADGQVVVADPRDSTPAGNYVRIQHGDSGYQSQYLHLSQVLVGQGAQVSRGQLIGKSGNTAGQGNTVSPHLHFEVKQGTGDNAISVDPYGWEGSGTDPYTLAVSVNLWNNFGTLPTRYSLTLSADPPGSGLFTQNPITDAGGSYTARTVVTLTASASDGYFLQSWSGVDSASGDQAQVIMSGPRTVTATFRRAQANTSCGCPAEYLSQCATVPALSSPKVGLIAKAARLAAAASAIDLPLIRRFRDEVLAKTPQGQSIRDKFYQNSLEMLHHLAADADLRTKAIQAVVGLQPVMKDLLDGAGKQAMSADQTSAFNGFIQKLNAVGGVQLKSAIQGELARIGPLENLAGKTSAESRQRVLGLPLQITNPKINATGAIEFTVTGDLSGKLRVEFSEDLIKWTALDLAPVNQLPAVLRDERPVSANQRYYRVTVLP